jgi:iron complex transport system ATP-binding protein
VDNDGIAVNLPSSGPSAPGGAGLELDHVSVRYPGSPTPALSEVSLRVAPGEFTALLGANGAGKSTLLRVGAGLLFPTAGAARVAGHDTREASRIALARLVAFVPQVEGVAAGFRVRDVVAMGRAPHQGVWMRESDADRAAVEEAISRCDLSALAERRIETLSGGEQRRVAIARALAQRPAVLLLDEPAAFLDVRHRLGFYGLLAEAATRDRVACAVAMHDLEAAARFATRVVLVRQGRVIASGTPAEVMTSSSLSDALEAEIAVGIDPASGGRYFLPIRA